MGSEWEAGTLGPLLSAPRWALAQEGEVAALGTCGGVRGNSGLCSGRRLLWSLVAWAWSPLEPGVGERGALSGCQRPQPRLQTRPLRA